MRAAVLHGIGERLLLQDVADPKPGSGEAVVRLSAAALNHRDVWIRKGQYAGLKFPIVLGSDGAGEVIDVGEGVDRSWIGKAVIVNASLGWGDSEKAQDGRTFRILGLPEDGTFAEQVRVPAENLHDKPDHLSYHESAALPLAGHTAFRALVPRGGLVTGERVLVTGAGGGAASFAVQFAAALGSEVWVTVGSDEKLAHAMRLGAAGGVLYRSENWSHELRTAVSGGFDLIVDSAGGDGFLKLIDLAAPGGRIVFFGATNGNPSESNLRKVFWRQLSLLGTTMGSPRDFRNMIDLVCRKKIRPVVDSVYPLAQADAALDRMEEGTQSGKIVLEIK